MVVVDTIKVLNLNLTTTRADPGFEVRGGANGLENLKTGGGGGGGVFFC